ncbi:hypothetical protein CIHG_10036 [Coccidioides immitis H538.4]|uniref:Uncharacterized protein n=1 Tax=Coccidioides immitis H538.4 TaxID=396776 RepID=A0A0J8S746_COCIT|nr:hypothetical protein CIHG_10036 [Coccidioides immitis H538.4]
MQLTLVTSDGMFWLWRLRLYRVPIAEWVDQRVSGVRNSEIAVFPNERGWKDAIIPQGGNRRAQSSGQPNWPFQREAAASPMSARSALFCAPEWSAQRGCCGGRYTASVALVLVSVVGIVQGAPGQGSETQTTRSHPVCLHHPRPALHNRGGEWLTVAGLNGGCSPGRRGRIIRVGFLFDTAPCPRGRWEIIAMPDCIVLHCRRKSEQQRSGSSVPCGYICRRQVECRIYASVGVFPSHILRSPFRCLPLRSLFLADPSRCSGTPIRACESSLLGTKRFCSEFGGGSFFEILRLHTRYSVPSKKKENTVSFVESSVYEAMGTDCAEPHRGPSVEFPIRALATACMALYSNGNILLKPNLTGTEGINTEQPPSRRPLSSNDKDPTVPCDWGLMP